MTKCPHCNDTTDHKTPKALCGCMAGLEGWVCRCPGTPGYPTRLPKSWYDPAGRLHVAPPDYINDPAQTVRGLENLTLGKKGHYHLPKPPRFMNGKWCCHLSVKQSFGEWRTNYCYGSTMVEAITRAVHVMMLAEWKDKE